MPCNRKKMSRKCDGRGVHSTLKHALPNKKRTPFYSETMNSLTSRVTYFSFCSGTSKKSHSYASPEKKPDCNVRRPNNTWRKGNTERYLIWMQSQIIHDALPQFWNMRAKHNAEVVCDIRITTYRI